MSKVHKTHCGETVICISITQTAYVYYGKPCIQCIYVLLWVLFRVFYDTADVTI